MGVCMMCGYDNEKRDHGVGDGVNVLCTCDSEDREDGVGDGVNATMLSETLEKH